MDRTGGDEHADELSKAPPARVNELDVLIEIERQLFELYAARAVGADARAAGQLTLVFAITTLTVTAANSLVLSSVMQVLAVAGYITLALTVLAVLFVRSVAALQLRGHHITTQSRGSKAAVARLHGFAPLVTRDGDNVGGSPGARIEAAHTDPINVRLAVLEFWRARANDAHEMAQTYDRWTGVATLLLTLGLLCLATLGCMVIIREG